MSENYLKTSENRTFLRGKRDLMARHDIDSKDREWIIKAWAVNERELAALAYFAIQELDGLLMTVFAEHEEAASPTAITRIQDSLSWIAEELGPRPPNFTEGMSETQKQTLIDEVRAHFKASTKETH